MIITLFLKVFSYFINFIAWILPNFQLPNYIIENVENSVTFMKTINGYFPLEASIKGLILILTFEFFIIIARLIMGLISLVRGGGKVEV